MALNCIFTNASRVGWFQPVRSSSSCLVLPYTSNRNASSSGRSGRWETATANELSFIQRDTSDARLKTGAVTTILNSAMEQSLNSRAWGSEGLRFWTLKRRNELTESLNLITREV